MPLKYLSNFRRTLRIFLKLKFNLENFLEMPLINCEINLILTWSTDCIISSATGATKFSIIDTKLHVPFITLLTKDNAKLLQQLKSGFERKINWNKYQSKSINRKTKPSLGLVN